jgi:tRNA-specific 2-thiouridylase
VNHELLAEYAGDSSRRGPVPPASLTGAAGGASCGDLVRISLVIENGRIAAVRYETEGCAPTAAAGAVTAELTEGLEVLDAARLDAEAIADALGGLSPQGRHAAGLAADALHRALAAAAGSGVTLARPPAGHERVLVAMSGGVDSAVAALLERERGAEVVAVTLKLWADRRTDGTQACCSPEAVVGARSLAHGMSLPHLTLDLEEDFRRRVVADFVHGYESGRTPNPCVICNGGVRLDAMVALADRLGAGALVTGHYARVVSDADGPLLRMAVDSAKDQSYMLSGLRPSTLARLRFPLGGLTKPEVRRLAEAAGLPVAQRRESQDLCFLAGEGKRAFLARYASAREVPGDIVDTDGVVVGRHPGHRNFTVGQRRGLRVGGADGPLYVIATDARTNRVVVGTQGELAERRVRVRDAVLHRAGAQVDRVRLRYHAQTLGCRLPGLPAGMHDEIEVELEEPAFGVAPGQTACLMRGDLVIGSGTIA